MGAQFVCPTCGASIGLAQESKEVVSEAMGKFNEMKNNLLKKKKDES